MKTLQITINLPVRHERLTDFIDMIGEGITDEALENMSKGTFESAIEQDEISRRLWDYLDLDQADITTNITT